MNGDYGFFKNKDLGHFLELYYEIEPNNLGLSVVESGGFQAACQIEISIFRNKGSQPFWHRSYTLRSPIRAERDSNFNLIDVRRIPMTPGEYQIHINARDLITRRNGSLIIRASYEPLEYEHLSSIQLIETSQPSDVNNRFTKGGLLLTPKLGKAVCEKQDGVTFYIEPFKPELLGTGARLELGLSSVGGTEVAEFKKSISIEPEFPSIMHSMKWDSLTRGYYELSAKLFNAHGAQVAEQKRTLRVTSKQSYDELRTLPEIFSLRIGNKQLQQYLEYMEPILDFHYQDQITALSPKDSVELKLLFYDFWKTRNAEVPYAAFIYYLNQVRIVNKELSEGPKAGYKTHRGKVYLKYGAPNDIYGFYEEEGALPYEIWHYYTNGEVNGNSQFVFYSRTFAQNEFELLHSTAVGELRNPNWPETVYRRSRAVRGQNRDLTRDNSWTSPFATIPR